MFIVCGMFIACGPMVSWCYSFFDSPDFISCAGLCCQCQVNMVNTVRDEETKSGKQHGA